MDADHSLNAEVMWAHRYNGYDRLAQTPEALGRLIQPMREEWLSSRLVPDWCGVDLLRGWAFYLTREDRHRGGGTLDDEWNAVLNALRAHEAATGADRPPPVRGSGIALPIHFSTEPRRHKDDAFLAAKQARLWEEHVGPINQFVDQVKVDVAERRKVLGEPERPVVVPYVDPDSGGVLARVLFLLESPAGPAALGSEMLSADNNDPTAKNMWLAYEQTGMPRTFGLHWNAVPWYIGDGKKNKSVTPSDVEQGRHYLGQLLDLAPDIRVVLALGKPAQTSIAGYERDLRSRGVEVIAAPHPSPISAGVTRGKSLELLNEAVARAHDIGRA